VLCFQSLGSFLRRRMWQIERATAHCNSSNSTILLTHHFSSFYIFERATIPPRSQVPPAIVLLLSCSSLLELRLKCCLLHDVHFAMLQRKFNALKLSFPYRFVGHAQWHIATHTPFYLIYIHTPCGPGAGGSLLTTGARLPPLPPPP
jgi:hypothetical protein